MGVRPNYPQRGNPFDPVPWYLESLGDKDAYNPLALLKCKPWAGGVGFGDWGLGLRV